MTGLLLLAALAQDPDAAKILEKFKAARPADADLALYGLDWEPDLRAAKARASKEGRPVLLIVVTNSYGDMFSGHC